MDLEFVGRTSIQMTVDARIAKGSPEPPCSICFINGLKFLRVPVPCAPRNPKIEVDEVDTSRVATASEQEIVGLDVAMEDTA